MYLLELKNINKSYKLSGNEKFNALSIVISTLSGLLPANKAAKSDSVEYLRRE